MKSKKVYIILIAILLVFCITMFLMFGLDELRKGGYNATIVVDKDTLWTFSDKQWGNVTSHDEYNWKKYNVYLNRVKQGNYYLWYNDKWYAFDDNKEAVVLDGGSFLAINSNYDIPVYDFEINDIDDYSYVNEELKKNKLPIDNYYTVSKKIVFDYDNDGEDEYFYIISNVFPTDFNPEKVFSMVFMVKGDKTYSIYKGIDTNTGFNGCRPYFNGFLDVDNDSKYEFILSCDKYSVSGSTRMLFDFENNKFKILISNNK